MPVDKVVERAEKKFSQSNVTFVFFDLFWNDCTAVFEDALEERYVAIQKTAREVTRTVVIWICKKLLISVFPFIEP